VENSKRSSIAYYVSAHGYGHGVRSCQIIQALNAEFPQVTVHVISELPWEFLANQIDVKRNVLRADSFDVGMTQLDSIRVDVPSTLARIQKLYARREDRAAREAAYLVEQGIGLVVVDIPALPVEAAARIGIPRLAVGNFGWDWIYSEFVSQAAGWQPIVDILREEYAQTNLLLRLPFCERMKVFPRIEDIPLVASPGKSRKAEIVDLTGCDPGRKWILLSFTTLAWSETALARVERLKEYEFFTVLPLEWHRGNIHPLHRGQMPFSDILASVDAVISKPGFGILSDCIANKKPLIYADRSDFREYAILVEALQKYIRHVHIPSAELYEGNLRESLAQIWDAPEARENMALGGDRIAARRIVEHLRSF